MCLIPGGVLLRGDQPLIQVDDAYVEAIDGGGWAIGNPLVRYTLRRQGATIGVSSITDVGTGRDWSRSKGPDGFITVNDQRIAIGSSLTTFTNATVSEWWGGVRLDVHYRIAAYALDITRTYAVYPTSSVVEVWTTYQAGNRQLTLADLNDYAFSVENGTMKWVTGLGTPDDAGGSFTREDRRSRRRPDLRDRRRRPRLGNVRAVVFDPDARSAVLRRRVVVGIMARSRDAPRRHDRSAGGHAVVQDDARRARDARDAARASSA